MDIFILALLPENGLKPKFSQLLRIAHTYHAWYYLIHKSKSASVQSLWARCRLHTRINVKLLDIIIERSGNALLDVESRDGHGMEWCCRNLPRMQNLHLRFTFPSEIIWLSTAKGNNIERLHIDGSNAYCSSQGTKTYLPHLCNGETPSLKHLHLDGIRLPWATGRYTKLVTLKIIVGSLKLEGDGDFHAIFSESPDLEEFVFHCKREHYILIRSKDDDERLIVPKRPAPLRKLRRLDLYLRPSDIQHVLRGISTPKTTNVKVEAIISRSKNYGTRKGVGLLPEDLRCLQSLSTIQKLVLNVRERTILGTTAIQGEPGTFEFKTSPDSAYETSHRDGRGTSADIIFLDTMYWLLWNAVSPSCLEEIVFEDRAKANDLGLLEAERTISHLRRFDQLQRLTFNACYEDFVKILGREGKHIAAPNSLSLSSISFHSMRSPVRSFRKLTLNRSSFGDGVILYLKDFRLVSDSENDVQELVDLLQSSKCLGLHSTVTARWEDSDHPVHYAMGNGTDDGRWKIEGSS